MGDPQTGGQSFQRSFHTVVTLLGPTPDLPNVWKDELIVVQSLGKWKDRWIDEWVDGWIDGWVVG